RKRSFPGRLVVSLPTLPHLATGEAPRSPDMDASSPEAPETRDREASPDALASPETSPAPETGSRPRRHARRPAREESVPPLPLPVVPGMPAPELHPVQVPGENVDDDALKVIRRLRRYGHHAYLVGGGVRDLLLGYRPKDFDIATSARPNEVRALFRNC